MRDLNAEMGSHIGSMGVTSLRSELRTFSVSNL